MRIVLQIVYKMEMNALAGIVMRSTTADLNVVTNRSEVKQKVTGLVVILEKGNQFAPVITQAHGIKHAMILDVLKNGVSVIAVAQVAVMKGGMGIGHAAKMKI